MKINSKFKEKRPVISFEIFPPKRDQAIKDIDRTLEILTSLNPDFISVTCGAGGSQIHDLTVELAKKIKNEYKIEPLVHLTCINHDKNEVLQIMEELGENDINSILALRGDVPLGGDIKTDFIHASDLVRFIKENGDFSVGGACYPEGHTEAVDLKSDIENLKIKVDQGADHLVSQLFFDNQLFYDFITKIRKSGINVPVEAGIMPVINKEQILRMTSLCGASLPEKFKRIIEKYETNKAALFDAGMVYAVNQIVDLLSHDVDGIHIYTMNNPLVAERICKDIVNLI